MKWRLWDFTRYMSVPRMFQYTTGTVQSTGALSQYSCTAGMLVLAVFTAPVSSPTSIPTSIEY